MIDVVFYAPETGTITGFGQMPVREAIRTGRAYVIGELPTGASHDDHADYIVKDGEIRRLEGD